MIPTIITATISAFGTIAIAIYIAHLDKTGGEK